LVLLGALGLELLVDVATDAASGIVSRNARFIDVPTARRDLFDFLLRVFPVGTDDGAVGARADGLATVVVTGRANGSIAPLLYARDGQWEQKKSGRETHGAARSS